jgi:hypothetical protein
LEVAPLATWRLQDHAIKSERSKGCLVLKTFELFRGLHEQYRDCRPYSTFSRAFLH